MIQRGRGFGKKAERTKKCNCDNPRWSVFELRSTQQCEAVVTFHCLSCGALWDTKSKDARQHINMDSKVDMRAGSITYSEYFKEVDKNRKALLERRVSTLRGEIAKIEKEISKAEKEIQSL